MDNSGGRNKFYGRKQILAEENKLWEEENNCRGRKLSNKCIDLHAPQYLMVDLAWYHQRTMVPLDGMVPAYHGTRVSWYCWHGTSVQGVVGPGLSQREVHSRIFHPVLQIDNGRPENGVKVFNHAISLREIT